MNLEELRQQAVRIHDLYDVDLEVAFRRTMAELDAAISARLPKAGEPS